MLRHGTHEREGSDEWPAEGRAKSETAARKGVCACARVGSGEMEREGKKDENEIQVRWGWARGTVTSSPPLKRGSVLRGVRKTSGVLARVKGREGSLNKVERERVGRAS